MRLKDHQIIKSLLDTDLYAYSQGRLIFDKHLDVHEEEDFVNRTTSVNLVQAIEETELREQLDALRDLRLTEDELAYLSGFEWITAGYLDFLRDLRIPPIHVEFRHGDDPKLFIHVEGPWCEALWPETMILSIVNELYYTGVHGLIKTDRDFSFALARGTLALQNKMAKIQRYPNIEFIEFGTRRRFCRRWQEMVVESLVERMPLQIVGTSNVALAKKFGIDPSGTMAHRLLAVYSALFGDDPEAIRASHNRLFDDWVEVFGPGKLSIALTDTWGTDFFFRTFGAERAQAWWGTRQDSGDPDLYAARAVEFYKSFGINPRGKMVIFSDGLDEDKIIGLYERWDQKIDCGFGWGTNLTNDLGLPPLSIVVKPVRANGKDIVKLSDNPAKAIGKPEVIEKYKRIFDYQPQEAVTPRY
jgi:nicotinate phosphoribosyltransferase